MKKTTGFALSFEKINNKFRQTLYSSIVGFKLGLDWQLRTVSSNTIVGLALTTDCEQSHTNNSTKRFDLNIHFIQTSRYNHFDKINSANYSAPISTDSY
jgi:hypothetical protein